MTKKLFNNSVGEIIAQAIGIDVSKDKLNICLFNINSQGNNEQYVEIKNNENEITNWIQNIQGYAGKIVIESTGRFHLLVSLLLSEQDFDVRVINPLLTKKYSQAAIRKVKSDKKDSSILAEIALKEDRLPSRFKLGRNSLNIKKKFALISSLEKQLQQLQSTLNDYQTTKETLRLRLSTGERQIIKTIKRLREHKDKLEQEVENEVRSLNDSDDEQINRLNSIPGISLYAAALMSYFFSIDYLDNAKQWIAYAGLDVSVKQSGRWHGRCRLTKRGNAYIRKRLFSAAWGAVMNNQQFRDYYDYLKNKGRTHTESLVIIARKLVRVMFSLSKNKAIFDLSIPIFAN